MSDGIHVVCPQCNQVNRIPSGKLAPEARCGRYGQRLFTGDTFEADDAGLLKQMERSGIPVIVDFWAEWCGPCRIMAPAFEQVTAALEPAARFLKVNVDKNSTGGRDPWRKGNSSPVCVERRRGGRTDGGRYERASS